jgi:catechol 2,3-dioxygenase-like lactoylglutathione lyase family enzyme
MAKIKHIALSTQDVDKTAAFQINVFGMKEMARIDSPNARGYYLSDGDTGYGNVEVKYSGPDGVMVDVSETGWVGTSGFNV